MNNATYLKWTVLHNNPSIRQKLPNILFDCWKKSQALGIDPDNSVPLISTEEEFSKRKETSKSLCYYANDAITNTFKQFEDCNFGLALFDNTGFLLKLYGNSDFLKWAKDNKIQASSIWDEKTIGTNAVSIGLKSKKSISILGEEHYSKFAINFAMYFSPITIVNDINEIVEYGGIAIISALEDKNILFSYTADSIASSIALHFCWFEAAYLFANTEDGYMIVDQSSNRHKLIFISKQIFSFFNMPFKDMYYRDLEEIIDPYPRNKNFWDLIYNKRKVQNIDMELSIQGVQIQVNFSICPFCGRNYQMQGVSLVFNSESRILNAEPSLDFKQSRSAINSLDTKEYLVQALEKNKYNKTETAKYLGISRNTLYLRIKEYNL